MKYFAFILCFILINSTKLPDPDKTGGTPLYEAAYLRKSQRDFTNGNITEQELSQLLWASYGYGNDKHRTVPSYMAFYSFDIYVFMQDGVYLYYPDKNEIELKVAGDHREATGDNEYVVRAAANICLVGDYTKISIADLNKKQQIMRYDAGFATQDMYLVCADKNL
ncbi:MAG: nitroreductase family protein [archaeon]|nr:nitroreductase family protein [archaeon]